jgi:hypothetical protein
MKLQSSFPALVSLALLIIQTESKADTLTGVWSDPIFAGNILETNGSLTFSNNTGSAVYSGIGTNTISYGTYTSNGITSPPGVPSPAGCALIAPVSCQTTISFTGAILPANLSQPFNLGTITYTNGTSNIDSLLFGATLSFYIGSTFVGSEFVDFATTRNGGVSQAADADYVTFSGLAGRSFNVYEGATATGTLVGFIDDVVLTDITMDTPGSGFIGNSPTLPVPGPVVGAGLPGLMIALGGMLAWSRRRPLEA